MPVEHWFPTPVYYSFAREESFDAMQKELLEVDSKAEYAKASDGYSWHTLTHSITTPIFKANIIKDNNLVVTEKEIEWHLRQYLPDLTDKVDFDIRTSWLTRNTKHEFAFKHKHTPIDCDIAGCYYIQTNGQDGNITFWNSNELSNDFCFFLNNQKVSYSPQVGKILLFPSWLVHEVTENLTDNLRISLAFNIRFKRD